MPAVAVAKAERVSSKKEAKGSRKEDDDEDEQIEASERRSG